MSRAAPARLSVFCPTNWPSWLPRDRAATVGERLLQAPLPTARMEITVMLRRFVVLIAAALPMAVAADVKVVEEIAAKVNNDIITRGELEHRRVEIEQELRRQGLTGAKLADAVKQAERDALREQIDQLLLVQRGKDLDIKIDADVTDRKSTRLNSSH